jgi:uncharacterized protein DUF3800
MNAPLVLGASGVPLEGFRLVRVVYLDESGQSSREPRIVQAGVIVHGDSQIVPIEAHLEELVVKHIPPESRDGFVFHATDIYGGGPKDCIFHDKKEWPEERRWALLDDLVAIPAKFQLPVCLGQVDKVEFRAQNSTKSNSKQEVEVAIHAMAIIQCEISVELWMRHNTENEITHLIAENNNDVRVAAKEAHILLKSKEAMEAEGFFHHPCFPFVKIRDGLQFATKVDSRILQVADACAWSIRRAAAMAPNAGRFFLPLRSQIFQLDGQLTAIWDRQLSETPSQNP